MPEIPNIGFAANLPPDKAIAYFRSKGWAISFRWRDVWKQAQAKAFTVAGATRLDVLSSIRAALDESLAEGTTFRQFRQNLEPELKKLGWLGRTEITDPVTGEVREINVTPHRLRTIYRTNMQTSYMAGRFKTQKDGAESRPFWQYVAIIDAATRPTHRDRNGTVLRHDDPWWDINYPPNGWGCRCRVRALSRAAMRRRGLTESPGENVPDVARDPEWQYNPGKAADFDAANLSPTQFPDQRSWLDFGRPDLRDIPEEQKISAELLGAAGDTNSAHRQVGEVFGVSSENPVTFIETPVERVAVNFELLRHAIEKRSDRRERYAEFARKTLENPLEVYLTRFPDGKYRKQYIAAFTGKNDLVVSVIQGRDGSLLWNFFQGKAKKINNHRKGDAILFIKK